MDVLEGVTGLIRRERLLRPGQRVVAAVSGGPDSLCLLDCLQRAGYRVILAHFDHGLRPDSADDAAFCAALARRLGLPAVVARENVRDRLGPGDSLEQAARVRRYQFLARAAREQRAAAVATGHTADDQVETIVMHWLRGAGPAGLRGMRPGAPLDRLIDLPPGAPVTLVRPLLELTRSQTEAHCRQRGLTPRRDATNQDPTFLRNRIRLELLPLLQSYNPALRQGLLRGARLMSDHDDLIDSLTAALARRAVRPAGRGALRLDLDAWRAAPAALRRSLLYRLPLARLPAGETAGYEVLERADAALRALRPGRTAGLPGGWTAVAWGGEAVLAPPAVEPPLPWFPLLAAARPRRLRVPGTVRLAGGWALEVRRDRLSAAGARRIERAEPGRTAAFDAGALAGPLRLRPAQPGERLSPLGMAGSARLSDLFVDRRIPRPARRRWPVLECAGQTLWIVGLRRSRHAPLGARPRPALILRLIPPRA